MIRNHFDALLADATTMWSRRCDAATARAEAAEAANAALTARNEALDGLETRLRAAKQYDKRRAADTITALRKRVAELDGADRRAAAMLARVTAIEADAEAARKASAENFARAEAAESRLAALEAGSAQAAAKVLLKRSLLALRDTTRNMTGQDVFACDGEYFTVAGLQESIERALSGEPT